MRRGRRRACATPELAPPTYISLLCSVRVRLALATAAEALGEPHQLISCAGGVHWTFGRVSRKWIMHIRAVITLALACAGLAPVKATLAETLRCGSVLIQPGDDARYVLEKC